jgi:diacylglycerol kinase family enzyme
MAANGADICVILNLGSGKRRGTELAARLDAAFESYPGRFDLRRMRPGARITEEARKAVEEGFGTVVAAGGDGTICGVAAGLFETRARLGVLSLGTFNFFARSLGLPDVLTDLDAAVRVLVEGEERAIDIGTVNGQVFLNNASIGAYATILEQREAIYRRWGRSRFAAMWSVVKTLLEVRPPMVLKVAVDGELRRFRTPLAFIAANAYQLEEFDLNGADCVRDGRFALFVAPDANRAELLRFALRLLARRMVEGRDFELICGRDILIETLRPSRLVARDGERERMAAPFRFQMHRQALRVLVPAGSEPA